MLRQKKDFLVFASPLIEEPEIKEVVATLRSGWIGTGPKVSKFECAFRKFKGTKFAMALNSCSAALHLSMLAVGIKPGDEVIVPTMTFASTANAIVHAGARPVFVDCEIDTMNICPKDVKKKITARTRAIIPVHFAGRPCKMDAIMDIAKKHRLKVIEDCAHAIEARYRSKLTGTIGDLGCFSFYVTKNITTGEGGMVITGNSAYAQRIKVLGLHGLTQDAWRRFLDAGFKFYEVVSCGFKYNMTDLQAGIGIHQLARIEKYWKRRKNIWRRYNDAFEGLPVFIPAPVEAGTKHAYHLYTLLLDTDNIKVSRERFLEAMTRQNIGVGVHYVALHLHPYYKRVFGYKKGDFPNAEWISQRTVSLPISPKLTNNDVSRVIGAVVKILKSR